MGNEARVQVVVPVSGGKDSQACLKLAVQQYGPELVRGLFCDTQFEHPLTYIHVNNLSTLYGGVRIDTVTGGSVLDKIRKYQRFPSFGARHCTDELKIRETRIYLKALAEINGGFEVWYGMRSNESAARRKRYSFATSNDLYAPHEILPRKYPKYLSKMGVSFRLPILDWSTEEVFTFLAGEENPLYAKGFDRVGCFPCLAAGDGPKTSAFIHDDFGRKQYRIVVALEKEIGKSVWQSDSKSPGCSLCEI